MKPFLNKLIDTVTNAAQGGRTGKKLALGATQHTEDQASGKSSFQSVFKSAQNHFQKAQPDKNVSVRSGKQDQPKADSKNAPVKTNEAETAQTTAEPGANPQTSNDAPATKDIHKKDKASKASATENSPEASNAGEISQNDVQETVSNELAEALPEVSSDAPTRQDDSSKQETAKLSQDALAIALQIQPQAFIAPTIPNQATSETKPEETLSGINVSSATEAISTTNQAATENTVNNTAGVSSTPSFETALNHTESSDTAGKIKLDDPAWQATTTELPEASVKTDAAITSNPVDDSAQTPAKNENATDPKAIIENALASGMMEIQTANTPTTNNQIPADASSSISPAPAGNPQAPASQADALNPAPANASEKTAATSTGNPAKEIQAETANQTKQTQSPLAPVPLITLQVKETAESELPSKKEAQAEPPLPQTTETTLAGNSAETGPKNAAPDKQDSDNSSNDQKQEASADSANAAAAPKASSKSSKTAFAKAVENSAKSAVNAANGKNLEKGSALPAGNTPNDAGVNAPTGVIMQNISDSAVPVRETTNAADLKELLTIRANGGEAAEQVTNGIQEGLRVNRPEIVIKLSPENMGDVNVKLSTNAQQQLTARLMVSDPETQEVLHQQIHQLKQSLESQGIQVEHLTVSVATKSDNSADQSNQSNSQNQSNAQDDNRQQSSNQQSFQQQQQAQTFYQQFSQNGNGSSKFATSPWQQGNGNNTGNGPIDVAPAQKPEQHNPNGSISVFA